MFNAARTADQDMVRAGDAGPWKKLSRERTKAAFHAIAYDRTADLLANGVADPFRAQAIATGADKKDEAGHGDAPAAVCGKKVGALG
jgi:hypothetical protein